MEIHKKINIPLNIEKCEAFTPKSKLELNLDLIEDDGQLLKMKDTSRRKSSTGSTEVSKQDEQSESSIPNSPIESPQTNKNNGIFFYNNTLHTNNVFDYYKKTEEYFLKEYPEHSKYKNSKNYLLKSELPIRKNLLGEFNNINIKPNFKEDLNQNNIFQNMNQIPFNAMKGVYNPNLYNISNNGKFDLPICYFRIFKIDCKTILNYYSL